MTIDISYQTCKINENKLLVGIDVESMLICSKLEVPKVPEGLNTKHLAPRTQNLAPSTRIHDDLQRNNRIPLQSVTCLPQDREGCI